MRHPWANALALLALLLSVLGSLPAASRCAHAARAEPEAHACCPDRADEATAGDEACSGPCCAQPDLLAASPLAPMPAPEAVVVPPSAPAQPILVARARPGQRAVPPRGPPRRPPRAPAWLAHRTLLI